MDEDRVRFEYTWSRLWSGAYIERPTHNISHGLHLRVNRQLATFSHASILNIHEYGRRWTANEQGKTVTRCFRLQRTCGTRCWPHWPRCLGRENSIFTSSSPRHTDTQDSSRTRTHDRGYTSRTYLSCYPNVLVQTPRASSCLRWSYRCTTSRRPLAE